MKSYFWMLNIEWVERVWLPRASRGDRKWRRANALEKRTNRSYNYNDFINYWALSVWLENEMSCDDLWVTQIVWYTFLRLPYRFDGIHRMTFGGIYSVTFSSSAWSIQPKSYWVFSVLEDYELAERYSSSSAKRSAQQRSSFGFPTITTSHFDRRSLTRSNEIEHELR